MTYITPAVPLAIGDPVEVERFKIEHGKSSKIWVPATVCVVERFYIGVAFADGSKAHILPSHWRRVMKPLKV